MQEQFLMHHGVKGQKWGFRRYQNYDGTLTSAGKRKIKKITSSAFPQKGINKKEMFNTADKLIAEEMKIQKKAYEKWNNKEKIPYEIYAGNKELNFAERTKINKKYCEKFLNEMSDSVIKDLQLQNNESTKEFVKKALKENNAWNWHFDLKE